MKRRTTNWLTYTNWELYGWCDACDAPPRGRCRDLRYAKATGTFYRDRPHRGRDRLELE